MQLVLSLHNNTSFCKNKALLKVCICQTFAFAKSHGWSRTLSGTKSDWLKEKTLQSYGNGQEAANEIVSVWYWIISTVSQWSNLKITILYTLSIKRLPVPRYVQCIEKGLFTQITRKQLICTCLTFEKSKRYLKYNSAIFLQECVAWIVYRIHSQQLSGCFFRTVCIKVWFK